MVNTSKVKVAQSYLTHFNPWTIYSPWNSPGQNTEVGSLSIFQGIFPIQGSNPGLPDCSWILNQLSHSSSVFIYAFGYAWSSLQFAGSLAVACGI